MTDSMIIALILLQIPILLIFTANTYGKILLVTYANKNPQWVIEHPEFIRPQRYLTWMMAGCFTIAAISLPATINWGLLQSDSQHLVALLTLPMAALIVIFHSFVFAAYKNIYKKIPSRGTVKASLGHRKLFSYVPAPLVWLGFALNAVVIGIYLSAMFADIVSVRIAVARIGGLSTILLICVFMLKFELQRKKGLMDEVFGPNTRKFNLYGITATIYLGVAVGVLRIAGDIYQLTPLTDIQVFALISFALQIYALIFGLLPKTRQLVASYNKLFPS